MLSPRNSFPCLFIPFVDNLSATFHMQPSFSFISFPLARPIAFAFHFFPFSSLFLVSRTRFRFHFCLSFFRQSHFLWIPFTILYCYRSRIPNGIPNAICVVFVMRFTEFVCTFDPIECGKYFQWTIVRQRLKLTIKRKHFIFAMQTKHPISMALLNSLVFSLAKSFSN